jgi:hypothetical protein
MTVVQEAAVLADRYCCGNRRISGVSVAVCSMMLLYVTVTTLLCALGSLLLLLQLFTVAQHTSTYVTVSDHASSTVTRASLPGTCVAITAYHRFLSCSVDSPKATGCSSYLGVCTHILYILLHQS